MIGTTRQESDAIRKLVLQIPSKPYPAGKYQGSYFLAGLTKKEAWV
ncbi:hypothetical protein GW896_00065 [Candidatus Kuenenbacteria bacterium]|nr:hypothetical protein [Candidatus Kuenenbacteria bacterium]